jgi:hypothetical protein
MKCSVHFESAVAQAKSIFEYICPGQTFFAKRQDFNEEGEDYDRDRAKLDELESALKRLAPRGHNKGTVLPFYRQVR